MTAIQKKRLTKPLKTDRRVERTRQALRDALISLILEKGLEATTVQDILDRANVGRATFYAHFHNKEELLLSGAELLRGLFTKKTARAALAKAENGSDIDKLDFGTLALFEHAGDIAHRRLYKALAGKHGHDLFISQLRKQLLPVVRERLRSIATNHQTALQRIDAIAHFVVSSFLSLLTWWLDKDSTLTPEEMDLLFRQLTMPGVQAVLATEMEKKWD